MGLGGTRLVSLAEAREKALHYRKMARDGKDPIAERKTERKQPLNFQEAAHIVHTENLPSWKNEKHAAQWINSLRDYAFASIGKHSVETVSSSEVLSILSPIWLEKPETARRVKQRLSAVFDWAIASGHRSSLNPMVGINKALPRQPGRVSHFSAMAYQDVSDFLKTLRQSDETVSARLALEFLILNASRTGEVLGATWDEFDLGQKLWVVPEGRMKMKREHRVPLSSQAMAVLKTAAGFRQSKFVFPGQRAGKALSNMAMLMLLRRMKIACTVHGFRSSFRDWAAEQTAHPREVCEMALAHTIPNKAEAAYRRGDLVEKRRHLMQDWGDFLI